VFVSSSQ